MAKKRGAEAPEKTAEQKADEEILQRSRENLKAQIDLEESERKLMLDDQKFADLEQWDDKIRAARENDVNGARPCLTSDHLNQYLTQVVNDARRDKPGIKVRPVDDGSDIKTAKVLQEIIRHIEDQSDAQVAYSTAIESAAKIGLGFFRVTTEYVAPDSFDQEICIKRVPNTFACYLGMHINPDGSDAEEGWIFEKKKISAFKTEFPKAKHDKATFDDLPQEMQMFWRSEDEIVVCEYFYTVRTPVELLFLADGTTVFADEYDGAAENVTDRRQSVRNSIKWCKHTGAEILEKRDWAGKYIPIVEVVGRESYADGKRKLWGLVRPAKDVLRAYNYWLSAITEKVGLSPKAPFIIADGQVEGYEAEWGAANTENRAYLKYKAVDVNGNAVSAPKRQEPSQMEAGMMAMLPMLERNVQTALGMFRSSVGESESQQSGRAILALQRAGDNSTYHFGDNQAISIKHLGRILLDLAPKVIDTKRIVRLTGEDGSVTTAQINPEQEQAVYEYQPGKESYNLGVGTYDVTVTVGPSYNTKRQEMAEASMELMKAAPQIMGTHGDLIVKAMDWPMADKFAERFKRMLPPQLQDQDDQQDPKMQLAQAMQAGQMMQQQMQEMQQELQKAKAGEAPKMAAIDLDRQKAEADFALRQEAQERDAKLARDKAMAELQLKRDIAAAEHGLKQKDVAFEARAKMSEVMPDDQFQAMCQSEIEMPQVLRAVAEALMASIEQNRIAMQQNQQFQTALVDSLNRPKRLAVQRDGSGRVVGAQTVQ